MNEPQYYEQRREKLSALARERFSLDLSQTESIVIYDSVRPGPPRTPKGPLGEEARAAGRHVRGSFLRWIVSDAEASALIDSNGIQFISSTLTGIVDLSTLRIPCAVTFKDCIFEDRLVLEEATVDSFSISGSALPMGINATDVESKSDFAVQHSRLSGVLSFARGRFGRSLSLIHCAVDNADDQPLIFDQCRVENEFLLDGIQCARPILMKGIRTGASVSFTGAQLSSKGVSISFVVSDIGGELFLNANLEPATMKLIGPPFRCAGMIHAPHVRIGQDIHANNGIFDCPNDISEIAPLFFAAAELNRGAAFFNNVTSRGTLDFSFARISGGVRLDKSAFSVADDSSAVTLDGAVIGQDVDVSGMGTRGNISMSEGEVGGDVFAVASQVGQLKLRNVKISGDLYWYGLKEANKAGLMVDGTSVNILYDEPASWPPPGKLGVTGFKYHDLHEAVALGHGSEKSSIIEASNTSKHRIEWLLLQNRRAVTDSQPWQQFASFLAERGDTSGAKSVLFEMARIQDSLRRGPDRVLRLPYEWVEEDTLHIAYPIAGLWLMGAVVFWRAKRMRAMAPKDANAYARFVAGEPIPEYVPFNPVVYALENV